VADRRGIQKKTRLSRSKSVKVIVELNDVEADPTFQELLTRFNFRPIPTAPPAPRELFRVPSLSEIVLTRAHTDYARIETERTMEAQIAALTAAMATMTANVTALQATVQGLRDDAANAQQAANIAAAAAAAAPPRANQEPMDQGQQQQQQQQPPPYQQLALPAGPAQQPPQQVGPGPAFWRPMPITINANIAVGKVTKNIRELPKRERDQAEKLCELVTLLHDVDIPERVQEILATDLAVTTGRALGNRTYAAYIQQSIEFDAGREAVRAPKDSHSGGPQRSRVLVLTNPRDIVLPWFVPMSGDPDISDLFVPPPLPPAVPPGPAPLPQPPPTFPPKVVYGRPPPPLPVFSCTKDVG
jgi:hypothetical protein